MALVVAFEEPKMEEKTDFFWGLRRSKLGWTTGGAW